MSTKVDLLWPLWGKLLTSQSAIWRRCISLDESLHKLLIHMLWRWICGAIHDIQHPEWWTGLSVALHTGCCGGACIKLLFALSHQTVRCSVTIGLEDTLVYVVQVNNHWPIPFWCREGEKLNLPSIIWSASAQCFRFTYRWWYFCWFMPWLESPQVKIAALPACIPLPCWLPISNLLICEEHSLNLLNKTTLQHVLLTFACSDAIDCGLQQTPTLAYPFSLSPVYTECWNTWIIKPLHDENSRPTAGIEAILFLHLSGQTKHTYLPNTCFAWTAISPDLSCISSRACIHSNFMHVIALSQHNNCMHLIELELSHSLFENLHIF